MSNTTGFDRVARSRCAKGNLRLAKVAKTRATLNASTWTSSRPRSHRHKLLVHKQLTNDVVQNPARLQERCDVVRVAGVRDRCNTRRQRRDVRGVARAGDEHDVAALLKAGGVLEDVVRELLVD